MVHFRFAAAALTVAPVFGDLPVHCVRHQVLGEWEFKLGATSSVRNSCGHRRPDIEEEQPRALDEALSETKSVSLSEPNVAKTSSDTKGFFTMVYDEGFEVRVDGLSFFAFSRFDMVGVSGSKHNQTNCGKTMRGWYHDATRSKWGCYLAEKKDQPISLISVIPEARVPSKSYDHPLDREWHEHHVHRLNLMQLSWTARVYDRFVGLSARQLNDFSGIRRQTPNAASRARRHRGAALLQLEGGDSCPATSTEAKRPKAGDVLPRMLVKGQKPPTPCQLKRQLKVFDQHADEKTLAAEAKFPSSFDWGSHQGQNFLEPVMDQDACGSCYMVSTMRMLTARHKIKTNNTEAEPWSISFPLHCSEYNQGCKGGFPFLASKWSADVGLVPASCYTYNVTGACSLSPDCAEKFTKKYRAANQRYVGGWYGNGGLISMMQELQDHGPIVVAFEPTDDFMAYGGGIFTSPVLGPAAPLSSIGEEWARTDHAVLVTGWGEEQGEKYWNVQNSWGTDWGESGYFRIARGSDDSAIEAMAVAADVVEDDHPQVLTDFLAQITA